MDLRLGPWLVRPRMNRLIRGSRSFHVTPKSMEVLVCLAKREGRVVSRDEILQEVWPGIYVTDDAVTKCIGELRRVFHSSAHQPDIIETIAKRGYRTAAAVTWNPDDAMTGQQPDIRAVPAAPRRFWKRLWFLVGCGGVLLLAVLLAGRAGRLRKSSSAPVIQAIAVLSLADLSGGPAQDYFADAMTDELITELSQIDAWNVISRTSIMRYKGTTRPLRAIARDLGVDAIVEGTVLRSGSRVRITAQLIHAATDKHVWSGSFEREVSDVLALQRDVAHAIAVDLRVRAATEAPPHPSRNRRVVPEAYKPYLKGWYFLERNQFSTAASYFDKATAIDPGFALAYALLFESDASDRYGQDLPVTDRAIRAMDRARKLDDSLAEVQTDGVAVKFFWGWDWAVAKRVFAARPNSITARSTQHTTTHCACTRSVAGMRPRMNISIPGNWIRSPRE